MNASTIEALIDELERQIDATPRGDHRDSLEARHSELLDLFEEMRAKRAAALDELAEIDSDLL